MTFITVAFPGANPVDLFQLFFKFYFTQPHWGKKALFPAQNIRTDLCPHWYEFTSMLKCEGQTRKTHIAPSVVESLYPLYIFWNGVFGREVGLLRHPYYSFLETFRLKSSCFALFQRTRRKSISDEYTAQKPPCRTCGRKKEKKFLCLFLKVHETHRGGGTRDPRGPSSLNPKSQKPSSVQQKGGNIFGQKLYFTPWGLNVILPKDPSIPTGSKTTKLSWHSPQLEEFGLNQHELAGLPPIQDPRSAPEFTLSHQTGPLDDQ